MDASTFAYVDTGFASVPVIKQQQFYEYQCDATTNQSGFGETRPTTVSRHALIDEISEIRDKLYPYIEGSKTRNGM